MMRLSVLLSCALLAAAPLAAQQGAGPELKDADRTKLARTFGKWFEARLKAEFQDQTEAKADLIKECESLDKKLKTRSSLALISDWELILDEGREFDTSGPNVKKGRVIELPVAEGIACAVRLPADYNPKKQNYPGVLILAAGKAEDTIEALPAEQKEQAILIAVDLTGLDAESIYQPKGLARMLGPIGIVSQNYRVNRKRLFLVGGGEFGASAASRVAALYPMAFAACAWVEGEPTAALNAGNLRMTTAEKKADMAEALTWFAGLPDRAAYPLEFEAVLTELGWGRHYWIQALRFDPIQSVPTGKVARFKVKVDRATNTITLDSEYVYQYRLYLNDEIVDLDKEIRVVRNGETYSFAATRSVGTLLDNFAGDAGLLDAGMVFTAGLQRLDVPIAEASKTEPK